jgi:hypothetical protein
LRDSFPLSADRGNDGTTERLAQFFRIDSMPPFLGDVHHVKDYDEWDLLIQELSRQIEIAFQVRGVHDIKNQRWRFHPLDSA